MSSAMPPAAGSLRHRVRQGGPLHHPARSRPFGGIATVPEDASSSQLTAAALLGGEPVGLVMLGAFVGVLASLWAVEALVVDDPVADVSAVHQPASPGIFASASSAAATMSLGCLVKAISTGSTRKASMAWRLALHSATIAIALGLCAANALFVPRGMMGHRVNIALGLAWSVSAQGMGAMFADFALYSHLGASNTPSRSDHVLTFLLAAAQELSTAIARTYPARRVIMTCAIATAILYFINARRKLLMIGPFFSTAAGSVDRSLVVGTMCAVLTAGATVDAMSIAYAADWVTAASLETAACIGILIRLLGLFTRLLIVMLHNDERQLMERAAAEERLRLQQTHADDQRRVNRFVLHELRVPLNSIMLGMQTLRELRRGDDEVDEVLLMQEEATGAMVHILSDLLDVARAEEGALQVLLAPMDLWDVVKRATASLQQMAASGLVHLTCVIAPDAPQWVVCDRVRLRQVLVNLVSNALKFSPKDGSGSVVVAVSRCPAPTAPLPPTPAAHTQSAAAPIWVKLSCRDNGCGIAAEDQARLFQPFAQLAAGLSFEGRSTGLGLALVRELITLLGGQVTVHSTPGLGTAFNCVVPMQPADGVAQEGVMELASARAHAAASPHLRSDTAHGPAPPSTTRRTPPRPSDSASDSSTVLKSAEEATPRSLPLHTTTGAPAAIPSSEATTAVDAEGTAKLTPLAVISAPTQSGEGVEVPLPSYHTKIRVLVVDDVKTNRMLLARLLQRALPAGSQVDQAVDGQDAVEQWTAAAAAAASTGVDGCFHCICMDNTMPRMSGIDATRLLRGAGCDALVIGCTGNGLPDDQRAFLEAGADEVMVKPLDVSLLSRRIHAHCAERAAAAADGGLASGVVRPPAHGAGAGVGSAGCSAAPAAMIGSVSPAQPGGSLPAGAALATGDPAQLGDGGSEGMPPA